MFLYIFVAVSWLTAFLLSMKRLRKTAKIYFVILLLIIINLIIFFFVAVELEGWAEGLSMLFTVKNLDPLKDINVWMQAAGQIFFSLSIGWGGLIVFASGSKWNNNFCSDALFVSISNSVTSVWASIIMFSFFGFRMKYQVKSCERLMDSNSTKDIGEFMMKVNIEGSPTPLGLMSGSRNCSKEFFFEQIPGGMSMAFIGMTQAFGEMEFPSAYACLFFILLFLLGITTLPVMIQMLVNSFFEWKLVPQRVGREIVAGIICLVLCIINLVNVQPTGLYILELIDNSSGFPLLVLGFFECIGVCYIYGIDKFSKDMFVMTGQKLNWKWKFCWMFVSPLIILGIIIGSIVKMVQQGEVTYQAWSRDKVSYIGPRNKSQK
ncbi:sodium- and chloride-dependent transporter XTRP3A [Exaiptasia diaphana]|uniref:Uncharacterized protein n=1 Tax=Exaiptasia diaphana TaxID=2652724 RepID=A0A913YP21_EXADI|nr:sodium- and chloride-dependent transporter XTRP3A [Exaiptasia diaphana]